MICPDLGGRVTHLHAAADLELAKPSKTAPMANTPGDNWLQHRTVQTIPKGGALPLCGNRTTNRLPTAIG